MPEGIITKGIGGFYYVKTNDAVYECRAKGSFRNEDIVPMPGDKVKISLLEDEESKGFIEEIAERKNEMIRPMVSNIEQFCIVISCTNPEPDLLLVDKLLIACGIRGIEPVLILNKSDLVEKEKIEKIKEQYRNTGIRFIQTSALLKNTLPKVDEMLAGKITAFGGQSGVGKSTILNIIMGKEIMTTGVISRRTGRGKHTTRHAELFCIENNGYVLDTPGFSNYKLDDVPFERIWEYYPEMNLYGDQCKFTGCIHVKEPHCMIKEEIKEGKINKERYERYVALVVERKEQYLNRFKN